MTRRRSTLTSVVEAAEAPRKVPAVLTAYDSFVQRLEAQERLVQEETERMREQWRSITTRS